MSLGIMFEKYFNPISLQTLALLFTMIRAAVSEWSSGTMQQDQEIYESQHPSPNLFKDQDAIEAQLGQEIEARTGETESKPEDSEIDDDGNEDDRGGIEA
ncbi:hypothetical protein EV368DRAFT_83564 [Lentinula lateritia]|nr:hypothetical protein EV368DRAFT_83564 [Lentinula lateritia]